MQWSIPTKASMSRRETALILGDMTQVYSTSALFCKYTLFGNISKKLPKLANKTDHTGAWTLLLHASFSGYARSGRALTANSLS
jgi:hypothetical protein